MVLRAPTFWWRDRPTWQARLLSPAASLYGAVSGARMARPGLDPGVPVLCIGNFTVGGAGKTPTALAVARWLQAQGQRPAFLSRGYGRRVTGDAVIAVDPNVHRSDEVGDEPLLLSACAPTFVAADRVKSAEAAVKAGATLLVMDDGLQNTALVKTASIVVVDGTTGVGNRCCIPAGPLRAPLRVQWPATSLMCVIGPGQAGEQLAAQALAQGISVARGGIEADERTLQGLRRRRLFAFAGIGRPEKFFETLESAGLNVIDRRAFPDHHAYTADERRKLAREARTSGADLITTEKDRMRLPPDFDGHVLPVRLVFDEGAAAVEALLERIAAPIIGP